MAEKAKAETINLADVKGQVEAMLAEAKEEVEKAKTEAAKILADAKASISGELTEEQKKAKEERKAYWNELVEVQLFKDNDKYKDDVFVGVGDEHVVIKRGERVKIKRKFADALDLSDKQNLIAASFAEQKAKEHKVIAEM